MPPKSRSQQKMIYAKRSIYKTKEKTPKKWRWIWSKDWEKPLEESNFGQYLNQVSQERNDERDYSESLTRNCKTCKFGDSLSKRCLTCDEHFSNWAAKHENI